jgi:hypothetical protein
MTNTDNTDNTGERMREEANAPPSDPFATDPQVKLVRALLRERFAIGR